MEEDPPQRGRCYGVLARTVSGFAANVVIVGDRATDPFLAGVKRSIADAAKTVTGPGGSVNYRALQTNDNVGSGAPQFIRTAAS